VSRAFRIPARILRRVSLYLATGWTIVAVLVAGLHPLALLIVAALAIYTSAPLLAFLRNGGWRRYPRGPFRVWVVRPFWYAQLLLPLVAGAGLIGMVGGAATGHALTGGRAAAGVVAGAMTLLLLAGYAGSRRLVTRHLDITHPDLPAAFDGMRIVQLSDLHVGPHLSPRRLRAISNRVMALRPDLIAIVGDQVDDRAEDVDVYASAFAGLQAPLGVFVVPGNHDVYAGWADVAQRMRQASLGTLLVNEARLLHRDGGTMAVIGIGDPAARQFGDATSAPDVARALAGVAPGTMVLALAHNPVIWPALAQRGVQLTLSGHTHWGQLAIPALRWSLASPFLRHAMGAHRQDNALLYIGPGTGYWGLPFRIGAPAEVTCITLRRGGPHPVIAEPA
jgi:uncharacterized protein